MCDVKKFDIVSNLHIEDAQPENGEINHMSYLSDHIGALFLCDEYSDVSFKVDNETIHAHKVVLAACSDYFRALLYGGMKESQQSEIEIIGTNVNAFKSLLKYIYTGKLSLSSLKEDAILDILGLAHQYGFIQLEKAICDYLVKSITNENVFSIYDAARLYQLDIVIETCKKFIDQVFAPNLSKAENPKNFVNLSADGLKEIIERDSFYAPEVDIFQMVEAWAVANNMKGMPQLADVLSAVRFELMTPRDLFSVVRPTGFVPSDTILDALQLQTNARNSSLKYRGLLIQNENLAVSRFGTKVLQGEMRSALLDGNTFHYDMEKGYTRHHINEVEDHGILIRLGTQALVNHIKMLLWDKDLRSYSYYIEVSMDQNDWVRVIDYSTFYCRSWQKLYFEPRVVQYIRIVGTHNTVNLVFHVVSFEVMYITDLPKTINGLVKPTYNVATTCESATVVEGVSRSRNALLDGNTKTYDWNYGYTCHQIGSGNILVQLGQPYLVDSMRLLLWDCDDRNYHYYIEVSVNRRDWEKVCDKRDQLCRSWQYISFEMRPVVFIRIIGTYNTANEVFHCVHLECPAVTDKEENCYNGIPVEASLPNNEEPAEDGAAVIMNISQIFSEDSD
ncbi:unnamed protein product [Nezara viridula]|uniref:BTB domain-containing protein n=1 Tax=Nezara viridula TaxID=85310 RepID=A0A9P0E203_NEZVI|nr:unnamed protein product [Nezara viridula]